jgi:DNA-binding CsgD family transcriptional regulator
VIKDISNHLFLLFLILTLCIGTASLVLTIIVYKRKNEKYKYYLPIFIILTFNVIANSIAFYFSKNISSVGFNLVLTFFIIGIYSVIFLIPFLTLYVNQVLDVPFAKISNIFFFIFCAVELILFPYGFFSDSTRIIMEKEILEYSLLNKIILCVNLIPILYFIIVGFMYLKNLKDRRMRNFTRYILIVVSICLPGLILAMKIKTGEMNFSNEMIGNYITTSVLYLIMGSFTLYYFIRHYLHISHEPIIISPTGKFMTEYGITDREKAIIKLIANGYSNNEISDELSISTSTVKTHLHNIFTKTGARSRTELISIIMYER